MSGISKGVALSLLAQKADKTELAATNTSVASLSSTVSAIPLAALLGTKDVPVVILLGQSNTDGRGNLSDFPSINVTNENTSFSGKVKIYSKSITRSPGTTSVNRVDNGSWVDYTVGSMVVTPSGTASSAMGPEYALSAWWRDNMFPTVGKPLYIIKCAIGGTPITPGSTSPDENWSSAAGQLRELAREYVVHPALRLLKLAGSNPRLLGVFWGQGESDASTSAQANAYQQALTGMLSEIQTKYGFDNPRIVVMGLSAFNSPATEWATVKAAQTSAVSAQRSSGKDVVLMPTDGSDGITPASRHLADQIHYNALGAMQVGKRFSQLLSVSPSPFKKAWDFEFFGTDFPIGEPIKVGPENGFANVISTYGSLQVVAYPIAGGGYSNSLTWVREGSAIVRPNIASTPLPSFQLSALSGAADVEIIFRMIHNGDIDTKPGFGIRAAFNNTSGDFNGKGYLTQIRNGGGQLTMFRREATNAWTAMAGSPVTPTQSPASSAPYWYRILMKGSTWTVFNSPDGRTWTQQFSVSDATWTSGDVNFSLFNGLVNRTIGGLSTAHCAFDVILARRL